MIHASQGTKFIIRFVPTHLKVVGVGNAVVIMTGATGLFRAIGFTRIKYVLTLLIKDCNFWVVNYLIKRVFICRPQCTRQGQAEHKKEALKGHCPYIFEPFLRGRVTGTSRPTIIIY